MGIKITRSKLLIPLVMGALFALGILVGIRVQQTSLKNQYMVLQKWNKLNTVLNYIDKEYVDPVSRKDLEEKTIVQAIKTLDPHSVYIPAEEMEAANEPLQGNFDGIGVTFNMYNDTVLVINTIPGGPSERVGVLSGDRIITINDSVVAGRKIPQDSIVHLLRGPRGTQVTIGVMRYGEPKLIPITITRGLIPIKSVDVAYMITPTIGFIKISKFGRTTYREFSDAVGGLQLQGMTKLILDLRGNTGGYLDQAFEIANEFLEPGRLIVYTEGRARPRSEWRSYKRGVLKQTPVVLLIDEISASASEIVAGAIQDNDRGLIIGRRSFGKGLVQEPISFSDKSGIRLTVARYYTPAGRCIQRPYTSGKEDDYYLEMQRRYDHGEMMEADSIRQNDTVKYYTTGGRVVYGGGGIMPDIFVGVDTTGMNKYFREVSRKNLIYKFTLDFSDKNRKALQDIESIEALKAFLKRQDILAQFVHYASRNGVTGTQHQINQSAKVLQAYLKAYIGRNSHLDDQGFYPFIEPVDNTLQRAVRALEQDQAIL